MKNLFYLNLSKNYVNDSAVWNDWAMIREIISNAMDEDPLFRVEYYHDKKQLVVINKNKMKINALIMGGGDKKNTNQIGQFHEGLKLAALIGLRNNKPISITSGNFQIEFLFKKPFEELTRESHPGLTDEEWENILSEEVLFAEVDDTIPYKNFTTVVINNWTTPDFFADRFIGGGFTNELRIFFENEFNRDAIVEGNYLYNKGIYVQELKDYAFGYNLNGIKMNRDRSVADSWQINNSISALWLQVNDPSLWVKFFHAVELKKKECHLYFSGTPSDKTKKAIKEAWVLKYNDRSPAILNDSSEIYNALALDMDSPVYLTEDIYRLVTQCGIESQEKRVGDLWQKLSTRKKNKIMNLGEDAKAILNHLKRKIAKFILATNEQLTIDVEFSHLEKSSYVKIEEVIDYDKVSFFDDFKEDKKRYVIQITHQYKSDKMKATSDMLKQLARIHYKTDYISEDEIANISSEIICD